MAEIKTKVNKKYLLYNKFTKFEPYLYVLPALAALGLIYVYPIIRVFILSLYQYDIFSGYEYTGFVNYLDILTGDVFWSSLLKTVNWTVGSVVFQVGGGLVFALILNQNFVGKKLVRGIIILPWITAGVVVGLGWRWMLNAQYGIINHLLRIIGLPGQPWLSDPTLAMISVIAANIWKALPFTTITILAALAGLPKDIFEAASIDGANAWQKFRYVTLPSLRYILIILLLLTTIWTFVFFDLIFVMTGGGPGGSTRILPLAIYEWTFKSLQYGRGAALAIILAVINGFFITAYLHILRKEEERE